MPLRASVKLPHSPQVTFVSLWRCFGALLGVLQLVAQQARDASAPTSGPPIIEGYDPPEGWGWCCVDEMAAELDYPTPQVGTIKR
jgi:hypothetical protein